MKIKFLSIIASFFMVSCVITSCLNDDNNVEYSSDATIHAFALDTIGYGVNYKFTIDQLKGEIYNEDSLPVRTDTIIDRILIKTLTTASGIVTMKDKNDQDSIINIGDSIDLRKYINAPSQGKYLELKVWAPDMLTSKLYKLNVRMHLQDPDILNWGSKEEVEPIPFTTGFSGGQITGKQKSVILGENIYVYYINSSNQLAAYKTAETDGKTWTPVSAQGVDGANAANLSSIIQYSDHLYMVANDKVYWSANGAVWELHPALNGSGLKFATLLAAIQPETKGDIAKNAGISAIASEDGVKYHFYMTEEKNNIISWKASVAQFPEEFPTSNFSSTVSFSKTGVPFIVTIGTVTKKAEETPLPIVPWSSEDGLSWVDLSTSSKFCPMLNFPSIIAYNEALYAFGNDFGGFYTSPSGITWEKASKKFYIPKALKKRAGANYSIVIDNKQFIWIICSKSATGEGTDDVWRGRLNKFGFEKQ